MNLTCDSWEPGAHARSQMLSCEPGDLSAQAKSYDVDVGEGKSFAVQVIKEPCQVTPHHLTVLNGRKVPRERC